MAKFNIKIPTLFPEVFGLSGSIVAILSENDAPAQPPHNPYQNIPALTVNPNSVTSLLGTPIFETIRFQHLNQDNVYDLDYTPADSPLIVVDCATEMVMTKVTNRNGTIKELISQGDYEIEVRGFLWNDSSDDYPIDQVQQLLNLKNVNDNLIVTNTILNIMGIHEVVFAPGQSLKFDRLEGKPNVAPYTMKLLSDEPIELTILNNY